MSALPSRHEFIPGSNDVRSHEFQSSLVRAICGASPDGILVVDDKANVVSLNHRFLEVWGIPNHRIHGGKAAAVLGTSDQPILAMAIERVKDSAAFLTRVRELSMTPTRTTTARSN